MSLFAQEGTVKLYIKDKHVVEEETDTWVETPVELSAYERELALKIFKNSKIEISEKKRAIVDLATLEAIPYEFLARVIKSWSEQVPVTVENLRKVESVTLINIWNKLREMYEIG